MTFSDDMRTRAAEQKQAAADLVTSTELIKCDSDGVFDAKNLLMAIVGFVNATTLEAIADQTDLLQGAEKQDARHVARKQREDKNNAIRTSAARGDWVEFDRLVATHASELAEEPVS